MQRLSLMLKPRHISFCFRGRKTTFACSATIQSNEGKKYDDRNDYFCFHAAKLITISLFQN